MRERQAGPCHALRLRDLRGCADLVAVGGLRQHSTPIWLWQPVEGRAEHRRLVEVEARLRCQRCGNREGSMVQVLGAAPV